MMLYIFGCCIILYLRETSFRPLLQTIKLLQKLLLLLLLLLYCIIIVWEHFTRVKRESSLY